MKKPFPFLQIACLAIALTLLSACRSTTPQTVDATTAANIDKGVRQMAAAVSHDLAQDGPNAWLRYFAGTNEFFMAVNGKLQFASLDQAKSFLPGFASGVAHMELTWTDIRVDPIVPGMAIMGASYKELFTDNAKNTKEFHGYFTGLAVETSSGWKFRNAHWSSPAS